MSDEKKEYTADELLNRLRRNWEVARRTPNPSVGFGDWYEQAEAVFKRIGELGERDAITVKAKLNRLLDDMGTTEKCKLQLAEAEQNARRVINEARNRRFHGLVASSGRNPPTPKTENQPPVRAEKLLYLALPKRLRDSLIGDLEEEFTTQILPKFGHSFARVWYWKQAAWSVVVVVARELVKLVGVAWLGKAASWLYGKLGL